MNKKWLWLILPGLLIAALLAGIILPILRVKQNIGAENDRSGFPGKLQSVWILDSHKDAVDHPVQNENGKTILEIQPGDNSMAAAAKLLEAGYPLDIDCFMAYMAYTGKAQRLQVGSFGIPAAVSIRELGEILTDPENGLIPFAFLPGMRLEEIAGLIDGSGFSFSGQEFLDAAENYPADQHPFGETSLEGCMIPGSYQISRTIPLDSFLQNFTDLFTKKVLEPFKESFIENGLTVKQAVILASMVGREAMSAEEYPMIASVFYNRINAGMPFESDPTVQYAVGPDSSGNWWKVPLTQEDINIPSAYNTYQVSGFPPGPICSPDTAVFEAVAHPVKSNYYYFQAKCDGTPFHNFAVTYQEHFANICQ